MMRSPAWTVPCAVLFLLAGASAQQPAPPAFKYERPIVAAGAGPHRLAMDVTLLTGTNPFRLVRKTTNASGEVSALASGGAGDLRVFDTAGREEVESSSR